MTVVIKEISIKMLLNRINKDDMKIKKNIFLCVIAVLLIFIIWFIYSLCRFNGLFSPLYITGLSNPYEYYQKNIATILSKYGQEYEINNINTESWKIYEDIALGFRLKYPANFTLDVLQGQKTGKIFYFVDNITNKRVRIDIAYPGTHGAFYDLGQNYLPSYRNKVFYYAKNNLKNKLWYITTKNQDIFNINSTMFFYNSNRNNIQDNEIEFTSVTFIEKNRPSKFIKISDYGNQCEEDFLKGIFATFEFI